jgi:hypothetical protein
MRSVSNFFIERSPKIWLPFLGWTVYIIYEQATIYVSQGKLSSMRLNLFYYTLNILLFYSERAILNRFITRSKPRYLLAISCSLLLLLIFFLLKTLINHVNYGEQFSGRQAMTVMSWDLFRCLFFIGMSTLVWVTAHIEIFRKDTETAFLIAARDKVVLENQIAEARNAYFQHQLNPHLLFNTLNFIYDDVDQYSPEAAKGILLLSDVFRFSLAEPDSKGKVLLKDELTQINNLFEINRLRFGERLSVDYCLTGDPGSFRIIPLILLTLTENLFKHGLINDSARAASLVMTITPDGQLTYFSTNYKKRLQQNETSSQLGLRTVRLRLDQAYASRYSLSVDATWECYKLRLEMQL